MGISHCIPKMHTQKKKYRLEIAQKKAIEAIADPFLATYTYHGDRHEHNTRHITDASSPSVNSNVMHISFLYLGPILWMTLDDQVEELEI